METTFVKTRREQLSFFGFIFLALGFIGLLLYGNYMNNVLDKKNQNLKDEQAKFELKKKENSQLTMLIPKKDSAKLNKIIEISKTQINAVETKTILKTDENTKSVVYIQVGSEKTLASLKQEDFINKISGDGYKVIDEYDLEEGKANNQIRFFNLEDKILAENLSVRIKRNFPEIILTTKFVKLPKTRIPAGQLEVWIE